MPEFKDLFNTGICYYENDGFFHPFPYIIPSLDSISITIDDDAISIPEKETRTISLETRNKSILPEIQDVIFNPPATIVKWADGTKTVVKCQRKEGDVYSKEVGLAMAIVKKTFGNKGNYNDIFAKWIKE